MPISVDMVNAMLEHSKQRLEGLKKRHDLQHLQEQMIYKENQLTDINKTETAQSHLDTYWSYGEDNLESVTGEEETLNDSKGGLGESSRRSRLAERMQRSDKFVIVKAGLAPLCTSNNPVPPSFSLASPSKEKTVDSIT